MLGGGILRFVYLDRWPPGGFFDEVQNDFTAERILAGNRPIFIGGWTQMPALPFYLLAVAIEIAGRSVATVRGVSALFGTLTLPVFYLLARRAFVWPVAAASALMLAGSRWHITFSRVGFVTIIGPLLEVLAVLCLWKALQSGKRRHYLLLGVVAGVGLQTYYSFNLFPVVLLVAVVSFAARDGWRPFWPTLRRVMGGLFLSLLVAAVLLLPLAIFALRYPQVFFQRSNTVAIWNPVHHLPWPGALWTNTVSHLLMFNYQGDSNLRHNIPGAPLLNPIEGVLLALGLGAAIARGLKWPHATWLAWFVVMLLPAILTIEAPQAHRAVGAIPAVYLLLAQGVQGLYTFALGNVRRWRAAVAGTLLLVLSVGAAAQDVWSYFRVQVRHPLAWPAFDADSHALAQFIKPFANRYEIRVSPLYYESVILRFHLGDGFPYQRFRLSKSLPAPASQLPPRTEGILYVLEPFQKELFPLFVALYPHARLEEHRDPFGRVMFVSIVVPRLDFERLPDATLFQAGFLEAYYPNQRWEGEPTVLRRAPAVHYHFHLHEEAVPGPFTADWAAFLRVERPGEYAFDLVASGPALLLLDNQRLLGTTAFDQMSPQRSVVSLSEGDHLLIVRYLERSLAAKVSLLWQPPGENTSVIPLRLLRPLTPDEYRDLRGRLPRPTIP
ncbi:MAG TPA: glycosyltransferase family 39 protein [Thermoanaerobaculia bacterium]